MVNCIHYKLQLNTWDGRWTWSHSLLFALTSLKSLSLHREPSLVFLVQTAPVSAVCAFYLRFVQYSQAGQWRDTRDTGRACHIVRGHVTSRDLCWRDSSSPRGLETCLVPGLVPCLVPALGRSLGADMRAATCPWARP